MVAKPTTIITGFLGSGKTTYLNHLLETNTGTRYAIIENEFGERSIDSELILRPDDGIVELNNGCLCCTLNDNLYEILNTLFDRREEYDEIIIEATGVADPSGLAAPFVSHPAIKEQFPLSSIICLVDAELIEEQLEETEEALGQITFSDILLVNKTDLVESPYLKELEEKLRSLNPLAKIAFGAEGNFPSIDFSKALELFNAFRLKELSSAHHHHNAESPKTSFPVVKPGHHHPHKHTEEVVSHTFKFDRPFNYNTLYHQLLVYLTLQSKGLYRMKGLVWLESSSKQHIVQSVGKRLDFQEKREWGAEEKRESTIVFIGKNLKREGLERLLNKCFR